MSGFDSVLTAVTYGARDLANSVLQNRLPPDNLAKLIPNIAPRPVFLIHGGQDDNDHLNPRYYRVATAPKRIWEAEGGHVEGIDRQPAEYEGRVVDFLDAALLRRRTP